MLRTGKIGTQVGFQSLNEYDAVTNELFLQYELGHPGEDKGTEKEMQRLVRIIFVVAWLLCGCTVETFLDGGAPIFLIALIVAAACAYVLGGNEK